MRFLVALTVCLFSVSAFAEDKMHYLIENHILSMVPSTHSLESVKSKNGMTIVKLSKEEAAMISTLVHQKKKVCGGIMVVEHEISSSESLDQIFEKESQPETLHFDTKINSHEKVQSLYDKLSKEQYMQAHKNVTSFPNRNGNTTEGVEFSADLVSKATEFAGKARQSVEVIKIPTPRFKQESIVVKVPGTDPNLAGVVIGGHMDTIISWCPICPSGMQENPGADDDGSGTASVLELLRAHLESGIRLKRDAFYAFYAAEEYGLHGSQAMASHFERNGINLAGVMQLDMTAYDSGKRNKVIYLYTDFTNPQLNDFTRRLAIEHVGLTPDQIGESRCGYACSDHASWHRKGVPAVFPFEEEFSDANSAIHTKGDSISRLDYDKAFTFVKLGGAFMVEIGNQGGK